MQFDSDSSGQSIQIGVVLLFGILVVFLSLYQAFVVPSQNESVEVNHNQAVQDDMVDVRNAVVSTADDSTSRSVSVRLGTSYPSRALFVNPGPASGALRTAGTGNATVNVTVENASAVGDAGGFWNGSPRAYSTGSIVYRPNYNVYQRPPRTIYENTVLYNAFDQANTTLTDQHLIDGNRLRLVTLTGSLKASQSGTASVDVRPVSVSSNRVAVTNSSADNNVTVTIPSRLPLFKWQELLSEERTDGHVVEVTDSPHPVEDLRRIHVELEQDVTYRLQVSRVGVGSNLNRTDPAYLQRIQGNGSIVPEGTTSNLVVEVRDRFNNPLSGVTVNATTDRGDSAVTSSPETDADGRATLTYEAPQINGGAETDRVNVSLDTVPGGDFDPDGPANVTFSLTIDNADASGTGQGGLDVEWLDPSTAETGSCDAEDCTWTVDDDADGALLMNASTEPAYAGLTADFSVDNRSVATPYPTRNATETDGNTSMALQPVNNGTTGVYVSVSGRSDLINVTVAGYSPNFFGDGEPLVYNSTNAIVSEGAPQQSLAPRNVGAFGPPRTDISGNDETDLAYVDTSGNINITDETATSSTQTLVAASASQSPRTTQTLLAVGRWQGSDPSVFYADDSDEVIYRVDSSGSPVQVADLSSQGGVQAVSGIGDIDGDGDRELLYADSNQNYRYLNQSGAVTVLGGAGAESDDGIGVGRPIDLDRDGVVRAAFVDSNNVTIAGVAEETKTFTATDAAQSPVTAADVDDDGVREIVYVENEDPSGAPSGIANPARLRYIDDPLSDSPTVKFLTDENGDYVFTDRRVGVVS